MTDTGVKYPTNNGDDYTDWTNPTNAYSDNGSYAEGDQKTDEEHDWYDFDFGVPGDISSIDGIKVELEGHEGSTSAQNSTYVYLSWDGGTNYTSSKYAYFYNGADQQQTLGGSSDTWGRTWSSSEFSDANFRVRIMVTDDDYPGGDRTTYLDYVRVTVYYTEAGGEPEGISQVNIGDSLGSFFTVTCWLTILSPFFIFTIVELIKDIG